MTELGNQNVGHSEIGPTGLADIRTLLTTGTKHPLPNGDIVYSPQQDTETGTEELIVSPAGQELIARFPKLLDLLTKRSFGRTHKGSFSEVKGVNIGGLFQDRRTVALKQISSLEDANISMREQFDAMRALEERGVPCATPYFATPTAFVGDWVTGRHPSSSFEDENFAWYLDALGKEVTNLKEEGRWEPDWDVDPNPNNYVIKQKRSETFLQRYIARDPMWRMKKANVSVEQMIGARHTPQ